MAEKGLAGAITVTYEKTTEKPFIPEQAAALEVELEPEEGAEAGIITPISYTIEAKLEPIVPSEYEPLPSFTTTKRSLIIDIETTSESPIDGQLMLIGILDPSPAEVAPEVILGKSEEETIREFIAYFESEGFSEIIGYNVDFDYRWLYTLCLKYRIQAPYFMKADLYDLLQTLRTGQPKFVSTLNKVNSLEDWGLLLLGLEKYGTVEEVLDAWVKGDVQFVVDHNQNDVVITYGLWVLDQFTRGNILLQLPAVSERTTTFKQESPARVVKEMPFGDKDWRNCPWCKAGQYVQKGTKNNKCVVSACPGLL